MCCFVTSVPVPCPEWGRGAGSRRTGSFRTFFRRHWPWGRTSQSPEWGRGGGYVALGTDVTKPRVGLGRGLRGHGDGRHKAMGGRGGCYAPSGADVSKPLSGPGGGLARFELSFGDLGVGDGRHKALGWAGEGLCGLGDGRHNVLSGREGARSFRTFFRRPRPWGRASKSLGLGRGGGYVALGADVTKCRVAGRRAM